MSAHVLRSRPSALLRALFYALLWALGGCSLAAGCGGPPLPRVLTTRVERSEQQGIDYVSSGTSTLEIHLTGERPSARRTTRSTDVLGSDVHQQDVTVSYDVEATRSDQALVIVLRPQPSAADPEPVRLVCEPWTAALEAAAQRTPAMRLAAYEEAQAVNVAPEDEADLDEDELEDDDAEPDSASEPAVRRGPAAAPPAPPRTEPAQPQPAQPQWACAMPAGRELTLGRVAIDNVPREGAFVLLSEVPGLVVDQDIRGGEQALRIRRIAP